MTQVAIVTAPRQFDFKANTIEQMSLDTLRRTHKENDIYGKPVKGIYHFEVIDRFAEMCQRHNLNYEIEEIFAAQNGNPSRASYCSRRSRRSSGREPSRRISCAVSTPRFALRTMKPTN